MAIQPNSQVILVKAPLSLSNIHQLTFNDKNAQLDYFAGLPRLAIHPEDYTYVRKDSVIRYGEHIDNLREYNYCFYKNDAYSDKVFYAFITNMEYVNDNMTYIHISTDVWQTWQFDLEWKKSFVEREHVTDDSIGANTIPEGLEYGDYIVNAVEQFNFANGVDNCYVVAQVTELLNGMEKLDVNRIYSGLPQGCYLVGMNIKPSYELKNFVKAYDKAGKAEAIIAMAIVPKAAIPDAVGFDLTGTDPAMSIVKVPTSEEPIKIGTANWTRNSTIDGYTPKNNKLFVSPYNYLLVTNNGGQDIKFEWENVAGSSINFDAYTSLGQGIQTKFIPTNYKHTTGKDGFEWALNGQNLPVLSWNSDFYLNWEAVNGGNVEVQTGLQAANFLGSVVGGMIGGNAGEILNAPMQLANGVANSMQQVHEAEITPNQAKGSASTGNLNFGMQKVGFTAYKMSIKKEYAKMIDDYFSMFGYKTNSVKVPNTNTRPNWNYVKTRGANIIAHIPQDDLDEIKGLFNRGITLWHNPATFLDYSQGNN